MSDQKNLVIAVGAAIAILLGFHYFYERPKYEEAIQQVEAQRQLAANNPQQSTPAVAPASSNQPTIVGRGEATASAGRIKIVTDKLHGSINLAGGRLDDLTLANYHETPEDSSPEVALLSPRNTAKPYYVDLGWRSNDHDLKLPNDSTVWQSNSQELRVGRPVTMTWDNGEGLTFERTISIDDKYMFSVSDRVVNGASSSVSLRPYGEISRLYKPEVSGFLILHEGLLGVIGGKLKELDYDNILEDRLEEQVTTGGWLGFTDKYWLVALVPDQKMQIQTSFKGKPENSMTMDPETYQAGYVGMEAVLKSGQSISLTQHVFAGAKILRMLDDYEEKLGFKQFDLAIDFGWFYFITKPVFYLLEWLNKFLGNFGLAILVLTVLFKLLLFPMANKSYRSMSRMKTLQPKIERIKQLYGEDKMRMNQAMMELYQKEKVNPMSGCLPIVIQAPVFFCLYKVLFVTIEMRHAPFYGWINDLSAPDPTSLFNLFGLIPWDPPSFLIIGLWPVLMGLSMFVQQKLNPQPTDPAQAKVFLIMPIMMTALFAQFPAGLVIYWCWSNILSIIQQKAIMYIEEQKVRK